MSNEACVEKSRLCSACSVLVIILGLYVGSGPAPARSALWHRVDSRDPRAIEAPDTGLDGLVREPRLGLSALDLRQESARDWRGYTVVRYSQWHLDQPVLERGVVVRLTPSGRVDLIVERVARGLPVGTNESLGTCPTGTWHGLGSSEDQARLGWLITAAGPRLVWEQDTTERGVPVRRRIDVCQGSVLQKLRRAAGVVGRVYPQNPMTTPNTADLELPGLDDVTGPGNVLVGFGGRLIVTTYQSGDPMMVNSLDGTHLASGDTAGDFLFDPDFDPTRVDEPFSEVNAYYHLARTWIRHEVDNGYVFDRSVSVFVNAQPGGQPYDSWYNPGILTTSGAAIVVGQRATIDAAYSADVAAHELTHEVVFRSSGLMSGHPYEYTGMNTMPVALAEGYCDYFAGSINDDPQIGEYYINDTEVIRRLDNEKRCPDDVTVAPYVDLEIVSGTGWDLRGLIGADLADSLMYGAVLLLASDSTFGDFGRAIHEAALAMESAGALTASDVDDVLAVLQERGLIDCDRSLPAEHGTSHRVWLPGFEEFQVDASATEECATWMLNEPGSMVGPFQFRVSVPEDALALHLEVTLDATEPVEYRLYMKRGQLARFSVLGGAYEGMVYDPFDVDLESDAFHTTSASLVLDADSSPPLALGVDHYFAISSRLCRNTRATVSVAIERSEPQDGGVGDGAVSDGGAPDAGVPSAGESGCACRQSGHLPWPMAVSILLLVTLLGWRRRRG